MVFLEVFVDVLERTEHSDALHAPCTDVGTSVLLNLAVHVVWIEAHIQHLVVGIAGVDVYMILEVLTDLITPSE